MSSTRRPPSRWGIIPRTFFFVGAIVLGLGLFFFGVLAGVLAYRAYLQRQDDKNWTKPAEDPAEVARRNALALGTPVAALVPETQPAFVETRVPEPIALWAQNALLNGRGVSLSSKRDPVLTEWRSEEATATWPLNPAAGDYYVDVTYAVRPEEGGEFAVAVGGKSFKGTAVPTVASSTRGRKTISFSTVRLGTIKLPEGPTKLEIRPVGTPRNALMSVLRIDLIPPGAPGSNSAVAMATVMEDIDDDNDDDPVAARRPTADEKTEAQMRRRRDAERAAAAAEEMAKWKQVAAERAEFDRKQKEAKAEQTRKDEQERKDKREALAKELERAREAKREAAEMLAKAPKPVEGFLLIDAKSGQALGKLSDGMSLNLASLPRERLAIVARVDGDARVESVRFGFDGNERFRIEEEPPYFVSGGEEGAFAKPIAISPGKHTLTATSYAGAGATGAAARTYSITFTAVDESKQLPAGGIVTALTLVDCERNVPLLPLADGAEIDLGKLSGKKLTIAAETAGEVSSVRFELWHSDGKNFRHVESDAPFALNADEDGRFTPYEFKPGRYRIYAFPYSEDAGKGREGKSASVKFEFVTGGGGGNREPIILRAGDAKLKGPALKADGDGDRRVLTSWTDDDATATWTIEPRDASTKYLVEFVYACDPQNAGGQFELKIGDQKVTGSVYGVEGGDRFRSFKLADVKLSSKEKTTVTLRALKLKDGDKPLMTLKEIRLTPAK